MAQLSDAALLATVNDQPEAFGAFYERHAEAVLSYLLRLTANEDAALDLTTEVFATALRRSRRFRKQGTPSARQWLIDIAIETLAISYRLRTVKDSARRKLGVSVGHCGPEDWAQVESRISNATSGPLYDVAKYGKNDASKRSLRRLVGGSR